jgi:hypothetical protein
MKPDVAKEYMLRIISIFISTVVAKSQVKVQSLVLGNFLVGLSSKGVNIYILKYRIVNQKMVRRCSRSSRILSRSPHQR